MTNPFAQHVPTDQQQAQQPVAPSSNPFAQTQQQPATPQQQPQAPAGGNPFAQQQPAAPQQQAYAPAPPAQPQQAYAPQAPAQQQAYAPQAPAQQQAYAPQQQAAPGVPQFGTLQAAPPPVVGEGRGAKLPAMFGRLVLLIPLRLESVQRNPKYVTDAMRANNNLMQDRLTATVVVLDSGPGRMDPIATDGDLTAFPPVQPTEFAPLPYVRKGMWINQSRLISQARDFLPGGPQGGPNGTPGLLAGRVHKAGPQQNDPWYLIAATADEVALAQKYLELVQQGTYPNPLA